MNVLLIGGSDEDKRLVQNALNEESAKSYHLENVSTLKAGLERLQKGNIDVIISDGVSTGAQEVEALERLKFKAADVPVIILTQRDDEAYAVEALQKGVQDYLIKGELEPKQIMRAIRHAMIRHHALSELRALSTIDDLTGLSNRRGFMSAAKQQLKGAERAKREMVLLLADLDLFKSINDMWGHQEGDVALIEVAKIFRDSFRTSDLIARLGGDEFVVLALEAHPPQGRLFVTRLEEKLRHWNTSYGSKYQLALSWGLAHFVPGKGITLEQLIQEADKELYQQKREKYPDGSETNNEVRNNA